MDEFDSYLESTGSTETYRQNTKACFRNVLAEPSQLEGDWRVALGEINLQQASRMLPPKSTSYTHRKLHSKIHHQQARQTQEA